MFQSSRGGAKEAKETFPALILGGAKTKASTDELTRTANTRSTKSAGIIHGTIAWAYLVIISTDDEDYPYLDLYP